MKALFQFYDSIKYDNIGWSSARNAGCGRATNKTGVLVHLEILSRLTDPIRNPIPH